MRDTRLKELADVLLSHSLDVKQGEKVMVQGQTNTKPLMKELISGIHDRGALAFYEIDDDELMRVWVSRAPKEVFTQTNTRKLEENKEIDSFIQILSEENDAEISGIPPEQFQMAMQEMKPAGELVVKEKKWVLLNYPTKAAAQKAGMPYDKYVDYLLEVCTIDYKKMSRAQTELSQLLDETKEVRITAEGTDLTFSIENIPSVICAGKRNIPDGEVYTAPIKDSVNGTIRFNTPSPYQGVVFRDITLTFEHGKVIKAVADKTEELTKILDSDEGARYIGEFALGLNPVITEPMGDILFDEKICGSLHVALGQCYDEAKNGNDSTVHWDMVLIQRPEYGGGQVYFDGELIREDGLFVKEELLGLNPEQLK
ncbi:aminopeptidase [Halobacillus naozhouensis]|uniref:Aminopeptidase n=1 Tax=Halobacillus naozhouensis TaxID=554880 RepID=A0ABY8J4P5_9BACI|nr:aminopeptidase [Halobacillus naozhouensis]WFT75926.1 aminopeptidase [Halobacillus naozhouensis]